MVECTGIDEEGFKQLLNSHEQQEGLKMEHILHVRCSKSKRVVSLTVHLPAYTAEQQLDARPCPCGCKREIPLCYSREKGVQRGFLIQSQP